MGRMFEEIPALKHFASLLLSCVPLGFLRRNSRSGGEYSGKRVQSKLMLNKIQIQECHTLLDEIRFSNPPESRSWFRIISRRSGQEQLGSPLGFLQQLLESGRQPEGSPLERNHALDYQEQRQSVYSDHSLKPSFSRWVARAAAVGTEGVGLG
jgi:hypothetical protein